MNNEQLRRNYLILHKDLYRIRNKIRKAIGDYDELFSFVKDGIMIDDEIAQKDEFEQIKNELDFINSDLTNEIIPRISNKI